MSQRERRRDQRESDVLCPRQISLSKYTKPNYRYISTFPFTDFSLHAFFPHSCQRNSFDRDSRIFLTKVPRVSRCCLLARISHLDVATLSTLRSEAPRLSCNRKNNGRSRKRATLTDWGTHTQKNSYVHSSECQSHFKCLMSFHVHPRKSPLRYSCRENRIH